MLIENSQRLKSANSRENTGISDAGADKNWERDRKFEHSMSIANLTLKFLPSFILTSIFLFSIYHDFIYHLCLDLP